MALKDGDQVEIPNSRTFSLLKSTQFLSLCSALEQVLFIHDTKISLLLDMKHAEDWKHSSQFS